MAVFQNSQAAGGRYGKTRGIATTQAKTAELIGQALEQQGKILGDQTNIMADQFKFQRRVRDKS